MSSGTGNMDRGAEYASLDTGYASRDAGMHEDEPYTVATTDDAGSSSKPLKLIALIVGCAVVAAGIGFGVAHLLNRNQDSTIADESGDASVIDDGNLFRKPFRKGAIS